METPTSNQPPRGAQGRRLLGPATLRTCPFASLLSQVRACRGPGGYCRRSRNGGPQTCLPAACGVAQRGPNTDHLHQHKLKTLARGQASRGGRQEASLGAASSGRLARRRRDQGRGTSRGTRDTSHDDQRRQAGASRAVSSFPLWCKGSKRRQGHQVKASVSVQQEQDHRNGRKEVIVEPQPVSPPEPLTGENQL